MDDDFLAKIEPPAVARWYRRLAQSQIKEAPELQPALAGAFLLKWLDNRQPTATYAFTAPDHVKKAQVVSDVLAYHHNVFMTYQKGRVGSGEKWVGILPRLQGTAGFTKWDMKSELSLQYESLCDIAPKIWDIARIQRSGSSAERDILGSLRGFQLKSHATFTGKMQGTLAIIHCKSWRCTGTDRYDWNYKEHFSVPNPDFQSATPDAIAPKQQLVKVYHKHAKRLEDAGLAAPYNLTLRPWAIADPKIVGDSSINTTKRL